MVFRDSQLFEGCLVAIKTLREAPGFESPLAQNFWLQLDSLLTTSISYVTQLPPKMASTAYENIVELKGCSKYIEIWTKADVCTNDMQGILI